MGGHADFLHPFICSHVSGLMRFRDGSNKGTASNFVQMAMIRQAFREESMSHTQKVQTH
jgi:hypothetical protein